MPPITEKQDEVHPSARVWARRPYGTSLELMSTEEARRLGCHVGYRASRDPRAPVPMPEIRTLDEAPAPGIGSWSTPVSVRLTDGEMGVLEQLLEALEVPDDIPLAARLGYALAGAL